MADDQKARACEQRDEIRIRIVLAPERQRGDARPGDAHERLPPELASALRECAIVDAKAVSQREHRLVTAAEIFDASQAPAAAAQLAARRLHVRCAALTVRIGDAGIDDSIQRDGTLCLNDARKGNQ